MAAYLAGKVATQRINYMGLIKLMYLADRESISRFGEPISYDEMYSMDYGLVLSDAYDAVKGNDIAPPWDKYFSARNSQEDFYIGLNRQVGRPELDRLSDADIQVLDATFAKFGGMNEWDLSEYMHRHCPEWKFPNGSRIPVDERELVDALGIKGHEAIETACNIKSERVTNSIFRRR